jgi:uncharacterized caspase-like protein
MSCRASGVTSVICAVFFAALLLSPAQADKRIALVIGNSNYRHAGVLGNPSNDAAAIAALLRASGFASVDVRRDLGIAEMRQALGDFSEAAQDADMALLFYAGHGIEVDGINYLIPVDARLARDFDVEDEAISLDRALRAIDRAKRLRFVMLDACRDNPFTKTMRRTSRSIGRGLARVDAPMTDTLVAFSTEAGTVAADGDQATSPFTSALVRHLATPGLDLRIAFGRVRDEVMKNTNNRQRPFIYGSLGGSTIAIVDAPPEPPPVVSAAPAAPVAPDPCSVAEAHWKSADAIGGKAAYEDHLARFGSCNFAGLARARIAAIEIGEKAQAEAGERAKRAEANSRRIQNEQEIAAAEALKKVEAERRKIEAERKAMEAERKRVAALPPPAEKPTRSAPSGFDGAWTVRRSISRECGPNGGTFTIRISGSVVKAPAGTGSISPSGAFTAPGKWNHFTGTLRGNSGSGTYTGKCTGTFTASRN